MKIEITSRWSEKVVFTTNAESLGAAILVALREKANLRDADLRGANLHGADLRCADLYCAGLRDASLHGADLRGANLHGADLHDADLRGAILHDADLHDADLRCASLRGASLRDADLHGADLRGANLHGADLHGADLRCADLHGASLRCADLYGADLRDASLRGADLHGAKNAKLAIAATRILPDGDLIGWKKCRGGVLVKLLVPAAAKRSHAFGRKCRAEFAKVLEVVGAKIACSDYDMEFTYEAGNEVRSREPFSEDWNNECASGIHFFITRLEAENYNF